ncbi:hypothetical protein MKX07_003722 [Trichoderma sp. CBMAI-0711]|nr:hypothetical protein MKX07_003722 [Trichoderma sp. CBMAI-0711]
MRVFVDAQDQWQLLTAVYPLFKEALPRTEHLSEEQRDIQHVQLHQELAEADFDKFCLALHSLLSLFERLVPDQVYSYGGCEVFHDSCSDATDVGDLATNSWLTSTDCSPDVLLELARFIGFHGTRTALHYQYLSKEIQYFHGEVQALFKDSLSSTDGNISNAALLRDDETNFILSSALDHMVLGALRPRTVDTFGHDKFANCRFGPRVSKMLHLAFDNGGIWQDKVQEAIDQVEVPESLPTLEELMIPKRTAVDDAAGTGEFEPVDEEIVELLLASSLFHLNASHWLRGGLDMDRVLIFGTPNNSDLLKRWRPYVACSFRDTSEMEDAEDEDILSFGLLIMEMEAKRRLKPRDTDIDWITGLPSKDSMLKRALIITQRFCSTSLLFKEFPQSTKGSQIPSSSLSQPGWGSPLKWFDDSESGLHDPIKTSYAREFMRSIRPFVEMIRSLPDTCAAPPPWQTWRTRKIRIAIIDTGIDAENDITMQTALAYGSIKSYRGFAGNEEDFQDVHGHGTHIARLMLTVAPAAELYVAKIANEKTLDSSALSRIAEAIKWAHKTMKVDIISLSFGLDSNNRNVEIDKAIFNAISDDTITFAAAANNGGNRPRAYPANRRTGVICIQASDGRGNDGGISPSPEPRKSNFSTLGISIESRWKGKKVLKSGTSFATPIAAAIAANMLGFARYKCSLDEYEHRRLHSYDSIEEVLHLMAEERQGYHYIMPLRMWDGADDADVAGKLVEIARS